MGNENYGGVRRDENERRGGRRGQRGRHEDDAYRQGARDREYYGGGVEPSFGREDDRGGRFGHDEDFEQQGWRQGGYERGQRHGGEGRETSASWPGGGGAYGGSDRGAEEYGRRGGGSRDYGGGASWGGGRDFGGGSMSGRGRPDEFGGERSGRGGETRWGEQAGGAGHRGKGPRGYQRSDDRIREDISDRLSDDDSVDASDIEIRVEKGEVTLTGEVDSKQAKRRAEDIAEEVSGVSNVQNSLRVRRESASTGGETSGTRPAGPGVPS
jgi:hypothetical protein